MADFTVNTGDLMALANTLNALASDLADAGTVRGERSGIFGSRAIDHSMGSFVGHWASGLDRIHKHVEGLSHRLMEAAEGYDRNEVNVLAAAQGRSA